jgi:thiamine-phosphate pyrophosphorylase
MFENGLPTYHLRKTHFSTGELKDFISEIPKTFHNRIVIHTHHELTVQFNLKGIYLSHKHRRRRLRLWLMTKWLKFRKKDLQISATFHSIERLLNYQSKYDYVFLSPVFDSMSGNFHAGFSEYNLKNILQQTKYKVIARGGISVDKIERAWQLGFAGIAFHTGIWQKPNPIDEFLKIKEKFSELKLDME